MRRLSVILMLALSMAGLAVRVHAQGASAPRPSSKWQILDNSFLVEEAFNQEAGVVQNIFTWTRARDGAWGSSFTQEWPAPGMAHQLSYTLPFSGADRARGIGDVLLNYRYQLREEDARGPAVSPRLSVVLPTGREADGLGSGAAGLQFLVPASRQFGNLYVHANAGYTWLPDVQQTTLVAGSAIWRAAPMFNLMLEAVAAVGESTTVSPGFRRGWNVGAHQLVIGAAVPVTRTDGHSTAALLAYFSYELPFKTPRD